MNRQFRYNYFLGLLIVCLALLPQTSYSASDPEMELFNGGNLDFMFSMRSTLLAGPGVNGALYGMTAPNEADPFNIFGNPAVLGRLDGNQIAFTFSPEIEFDIESLTDLDQSLEDTEDTTLESFEVRNSPTYTDGSGRMRRDGTGLGGIAATFTVGDNDTKWFGKYPRLLDRVAIGYHQPFFMNITADWSGLRMRIRTQSETEESEVTMYASIKMAMDLMISADSWTIAGARQIGDFWVGVGLSRTDVAINFSGHQKTEGILSLSQSESAFNSAGDPWDNEYFNSGIVDVDGTSTGLRLGTTYQPGRKFLVGVDYQMQTQAELGGPIEFEVHTFKPLNLTAGDDEEQFDVALIQPDRLTETTTKVFEPTPISVDLPSSLSIGFAYFGFMSPNITFKKYFGKLQYSIKMFEDGAEFNYSRGYNPDWNALLGFKISGLKVGIGAIRLVDVNEGYKDKNGEEIATLKPLVIPRGSIGFNNSITKNITLSTLMYELPEDSYRISLKFEF